MSFHFILTIVCSLISVLGFSQTDSVSTKTFSNIFNRISTGVTGYQLDTSAAPNDRVTRKIIQLRNLRGGFNINEAIDFKIGEDRQKNEIPKTELDSIATFFKTGKGKEWVDNAMIWIYRQHFTYRELKQLVKFYKKDAGQKMASEFPIVMLQSLKAAEIIKNQFTERQKKENYKD